MSKLPYTLDADDPNLAPMGLIVLQTDETIEPEFAAHFADDPSPLYVSRIASAPSVSADSLAEMETLLPAAADLLPKARPYRVVGYGCTSASSVIGSDRVAKLVQKTCDTPHVTDPLKAALACADHHGVCKFALISPYVEDVNVPLRKAFAAGGVSTDVFGTFGEAQEANVVRISTASIVTAACKLGADPNVEAVFLSCTNLRTQLAIPQIRAEIGKPVFSSNQSLAWHMKHINVA